MSIQKTTPELITSTGRKVNTSHQHKYWPFPTLNIQLRYLGRVKTLKNKVSLKHVYVTSLTRIGLGMLCRSELSFMKVSWVCRRNMQKHFWWKKTKWIGSFYKKMYNYSDEICSVILQCLGHSFIIFFF